MSKIIDYVKANYKDFLSLVFFLVCYGTSICLFLGGVKDPAAPSDLQFPVFLPLAIADTVLIIGFIFLENKLFKLKINIPLIIILSCLFIINLIVIITTPLENTISFVYPNQPESITVTITNEYKVEYILCFALLLFNIYISFNYLLYRIKFNKSFAWLCYIIIVTALVFAIYSYITEAEVYKLFFEDMRYTLVQHNPKSFTGHRNNYAAILLGAAFCSYAMNAITKKRLFYILALFFSINIIFPMSRLCLILLITLTLMVFIYKMIVSWKEHAFRNLNSVVLITIILGLFTLISLNDVVLKEYIQHIIFTDNTTGKLRQLLWECALSMVNGFHIFIGLGHGYFNTAFTLANGEHVKMPHNLYLQTYGSLGVVGLALLCILLGFAIYKIIQLFKSNKDAAFVSLIGLILALSYYMLEG